ncbi:MAG: HlyD family secretion protein [Chthoniobacterales bacterium]
MNILSGNRGNIDTESEMLPQEPPPFIMRSLAWVLLAAFLFAGLLALIMRMPETVHARYVLVPATGADPIQSPRQAVISKVAVTEGQTVKAGEELFGLRSDEIRGWDTTFRTLEAELRNRENSLTKNDEAHKSLLDIKAAEIDQAASEVKFRENHMSTSRDLVKRMERLAQQGGMSEFELVRAKLDLAGSEKDYSVSQRALQQITLDRQRMVTERARVRGEELGEIERLKMRMEALKSDLENTTKSTLAVRSPYDGVVISIDQHSVGGVVQQGQVLCQLSPMNAQPRARMLLDEGSLAKLSTGQKVRYFFDAFPYQRYGAVDGKLEWISPSAVTSTEGQHFMASGSLARNDIVVRGSKPLPLRVGMKGEAHIVVGHRTLIEYAFEPIRQLRESIGP